MEGMTAWQIGIAIYIKTYRTLTFRVINELFERIVIDFFTSLIIVHRFNIGLSSSVNAEVIAEAG